MFAGTVAGLILGLVYVATAGSPDNRADASLQVVMGGPAGADGHSHHHGPGSLRGVSFVDFEDNLVSFDDYLGAPLVVNLWQSSCPPCIVEIPHLETVHQETGDQIRFLGIAVAESAADSLAMIESTGVTYDMGRDPDGTLMIELGVVALPSTLFVTPDGEIAHVAIGALSLDEIRAHLP
jgi:cytochrome c biogenesis protein CcmG, thiol:disulfide interchange protein DsbE